MLARAPDDRPKFDHILSHFRGTIFPEYFYTFLQDYTTSLNELLEDNNAEFLQRSAPQPGHKIDKILEEWESIQIHLEGVAEVDKPTEEGKPGGRYEEADFQSGPLCYCSISSHHLYATVSGHHPDCTAFAYFSTSYPI